MDANGNLLNYKWGIFMKKVKITAFLLIIVLSFAACSSDSGNQGENERELSPNNTAGEIAETTASYFDASSILT